jgi:hypothetical protein
MDQLSLGAQFAHALAAKDFDGIARVLHAEVDFRALTPGDLWEATGPDDVIEQVLQQWFEDDDVIEALELLETDSFADRARVGYRFLIRTPRGLFRVEQQAYLTEREGRIGWMRVLCSGLRETDA